MQFIVTFSSLVASSKRDTQCTPLSPVEEAKRNAREILSLRLLDRDQDERARRYLQPIKVRL
jgi:hypothetical protein